VTLRLQVASQSEGDGLASDQTHAQSLSDANTARVAVRPGYPNPVQPVGRRGRHRERIAPIMSGADYRISGLEDQSQPARTARLGSIHSATGIPEYRAPYGLAGASQNPVGTGTFSAVYWRNKLLP